MTSFCQHDIQLKDTRPTCPENVLRWLVTKYSIKTSCLFRLHTDDVTMHCLGQVPSEIAQDNKAKKLHTPHLSSSMLPYRLNKRVPPCPQPPPPVFIPPLPSILLLLALNYMLQCTYMCNTKFWNNKIIWSWNQANFTIKLLENTICSCLHLSVYGRFFYLLD